MLLKSKKLSLVAVLALLGATLVAPPAWAATVNCSTSGKFTITNNNVVTAASTCKGAAVIPTGVTSIGAQAFYGAKSLTSVTMANSVTSIGYAAFAYSSLKKITIPNSVTSIGDYAFFYAKSLTSVTFEGNAPGIIGGFYGVDADAVANIGLAATGFGKLTKWKGLTIVRSADGNVDCSTSGTFTITNNVVTGNTDCVGAAVIPTGVTSIGEGAFYRAKSLTSITIPNSVTSIGDYAFEGASKLDTVTFAAGSALDSIGELAFAGADSLTSITIPNSVTSIGDYAFYQVKLLTSLTSITFEGNAPGAVGSNAFAGVAANAVVNVGSAATGFGAGTKWKGLIIVRAGDRNIDCSTSGTFTITDNIVTGNTDCVGTAVIPTGVTSIGFEAFYSDTSLTSINIPNSVTSIGEGAFEQASKLETVTFAAGSALDSIGERAFYYNTSLTSITIPNGVTSIGDYAFEGASKLDTVTFAAGSALDSIGEFAFFLDTSLTSINIPNSVTSIGEGAFEQASKLETVTFAAGSALDSIGEYAFYKAKSLTSITIPNSVTSIGNLAFYGTTSLTSITFDGNAPAVGTNAFAGVAANAVVNVGSAATGFGAGTTWNGLTIVGSADRNVDCSTSGTFTITDNVVTDHTNCAGAAVVPTGVTSIGEAAFYLNTSLTSVTIPNSVTSIDQSAFHGTSSLASINIPNSVTSIGDYAFEGASKLDTVTFAAGSALDSIGEFAFYKAKSLTSITIPNSVTSIGDYAFYQVKLLTSITFEGNAPGAVGSNAFAGVAANAVANIGFAATGFGAGTTWNGLTIVKAEDTTLPTVTPVTGETSAGAALVINGTDLDRITKVTIGGTAVPIGARTKTAITVTVPAGLATGNHTIVLIGDDPSWPSWVTNAKVVAPTAPTATPVTGETNAGATLVIKGTDMDRITKVTIGGTIVPIAARTKTAITVTVPAGLATGNYTIVLTTVEATALAGGLANVVAGEPEVATNQKVNAGSFNTYVAVYAKGYKGKRLSWKIAGKWFKTILTKDYHVFQRSTIAVGLEVKVDLFIDGERLLAKTVLTR